MKRKCIPFVLAVFMTAAFLSAAYAGTHSVHAANKTGYSCSLSLYYRTLGEELAGKLALAAFQSGDISAPGAYCVSHLEISCESPVKYGTKYDVRGCLGTEGSKSQTCCWDSTWEIIYDPERKQPLLKKVSP
jgi:hypothetical protein